MMTSIMGPSKFRLMNQKLTRLQGQFQSHFQQWHLTKTESEVACLILLGLSLREIAGMRGTSETTTRQQALSLYKKAGFEGRHQLAAHFLENLMGQLQEQFKPFDQTGT